MNPFAPTGRPFPAGEIPEVLFDEQPEWVELYHEAWRSAWRHVYESAETPVSPYMGEGCALPVVWIWDTSFMALFCRYASKAFPGVESLDNLYRIMAGNPSPVRIQHPDNPPLLAWAEWESFRFSGDKERLRRVLPILENHYDFLETLTGDVPWGVVPTAWRKRADGYFWNGISSGMDNTPRGWGSYRDLLWLEAPAQLGLAARSIVRMAEITGNDRIQRKFNEEYRRKRELVQLHWDERDGFFYDRRGKEFCRVVTPAAFWVMLARMATPEQAARMAAYLTDPAQLGGRCCCPTVARSDPDFSEEGGYWRGSVWVPLVHMTAKALEEYGMFELAEEVSRKLLCHMTDTFRSYLPSSIWECYKPNRPEPALNSKGKLCRADFCGWSALGPISLLIENIIGISAAGSTVTWRISSEKRHGIRNLRIGGNRIDLIYDFGIVHVSCTKPFTLILNSQSYRIEPGSRKLPGGTPCTRLNPLQK